MNSLATRVGLALVANAIALIAAAALLDKVAIDEVWFLLLVPIFTAISLVVGPAVASVVKDHAPGAAAFTGLIATYVALLITDVVSDSIQIEGFLTWILATVIVWAAVLVVQFLAPYVTGERGGSGSGSSRS